MPAPVTWHLGPNEYRNHLYLPAAEEQFMRATAWSTAVLVAVCGLTGCGGDEDSPAAGPSITPPSTSPTATSEEQSTGGKPTEGDPAAKPVVIDISIQEGDVSPAGEQVAATVNQSIELHVDSDAADELHVHSTPEQEFVVEPADDQIFEFSVGRPGQVEIELHETGVVVAELVVQP